MLYKIGIDYDSTLFNTIDVWIDLYNKKYNDSITINDFKFWDVHKSLPKEKSDKFYSILDTDDLWENIKPLDSAVKALESINEEYEVYIITATHYNHLKIKSEMLLKYFPFIEYKQIISCYHKQLIDVDIMIDDNVENLIGGRYRKMLIDYPWNRDVNDYDRGIERFKNWNEIRSELLEGKRADGIFGRLQSRVSSVF